MIRWQTSQRTEPLWLRQLREDFRERAHAALDQLLDRVETRVDEEPRLRPTLTDLTQVLLEERGGFTGTLTRSLVESRYDAYLHQAEAHCPTCQRRLKARPAVARTVETLVGPVTLKRPYFYCVGCRHGFYPLDEALGLSAHTKQADVEQARVKLGLEMPCERAATLLGELTDASMSDCAIHESYLQAVAEAQ